MTKTAIIISTIFVIVFFASCSNPITPVVDVNEALMSEEDDAVVTKTTEKDTVEKVEEAPAVEEPKAEETPAVEKTEPVETPAVEEPKTEEPAGNNGNWWDNYDWEAAWNEVVEAVEDAIEEAEKNGNGKGRGRDNNNGNHYGWYK